MDDQFNILFIYTHAKRRGRHNHLDLVADERLLICDLFIGIHFSIERLRREPVAGQFFCDLASTFGSRYIDDGRTVLLRNQIAECGIFVLIRFFIKYGIKPDGIQLPIVAGRSTAIANGIRIITAGARQICRAPVAVMTKPSSPKAAAFGELSGIVSARRRLPRPFRCLKVMF